MPPEARNLMSMQLGRDALSRDSYLRNSCWVMVGPHEALVKVGKAVCHRDVVEPRDEQAMKEFDVR